MHPCLRFSFSRMLYFTIGLLENTPLRSEQRPGAAPRRKRIMSEMRSAIQKFSTVPFKGADDFSRPWGEVDLLALPTAPTDRYVTGFALSTRCVDEALRLRYEVFNLELEEGLESSAATDLDRDAFDDHMTHLVLLERDTHRVVGTYRMHSASRAAAGLYSAQEYDLSALDPYLETSVELGRACVAADHRTFRTMVALWLGIGAFMNAYALWHLFGCCSLTSRDPMDGWRALRTIRETDSLHSQLYLPAHEAYSCGSEPDSEESDVEAPYMLPKLFRTYLRLGSKVISEPAIDREFGTVDFLVLQDGKRLTFAPLDVLK